MMTFDALACALRAAGFDVVEDVTGDEIPGGQMYFTIHVLSNGKRVDGNGRPLPNDACAWKYFFPEDIAAHIDEYISWLRKTYRHLRRVYVKRPPFTSPICQRSCGLVYINNEDTRQKADSSALD
jgi:hypothetical protein